jgi:predicted permease
LLAALAICLISGLVFGVAPARHVMFTSALGLQETAGPSHTRSGHRVRQALVVAEVALTVALLTGTGLLSATLWQLNAVDQGFVPERVLTARVALPLARYQHPSTRAAFFDELLNRLKHLPQVERVGATNLPPLAQSDGGMFFTIGGRPVPAPADVPSASVRFVTPGYFDAMGIPIVEGRDFAPDDRKWVPIIVSESLARTYWPGESAVNRQVRLNRPEQATPLRPVVGVVKDVRQFGPRQPSRPTIYLPLLQPSMTVAIRTHGEPLNLVPALRQIVRELDPQQPVDEITRMSVRSAATLASTKFHTFAAASFGVVAVVLAVIGAYGVMAFWVGQRRREFGVRMALGALPNRVLTLVGKEASKMLALGCVLGIPLAIGVGRTLSSVLFETEPTSAAMIAAAVAVVFFVSVAACVVPAVAATRADIPALLRRD